MPNYSNFISMHRVPLVVHGPSNVDEFIESMKCHCIPRILSIAFSRLLESSSSSVMTFDPATSAIMYAFFI